MNGAPEARDGADPKAESGLLEVRDCPTLIINRELASWLRDAEADPVAAGTLVPVESSRG